MKSISVAKITNPKVTDVLVRKRLFQIIDANRTRPIIWMSSPAGAGKTTLVASYLEASNLPSLWYQMDEGDSDPATFFYYLGLAVKQRYPKKYKSLPLFTPEYFQSVSIYAKRYFEILYKTLKPPCSIVFDNYHDVPANSLFHAVIVHGLDIIPEGIHVIIVSRNELHPAFARLYANNKISAIGWDEIRFTVTETRDIARKKYQRNISYETIQQLHTRADGWIAGILLMAESMTKGGVSYQSGKVSTHMLIFDYFAGEILEKMEKATREFLLRTSFLPRMTVKIAEKVSGIPQSGQILSELSLNNYFTTVYFQDEPFYQYHPLFKEFLQSRARSLMPSDELFMMQRNSAEILKESGLIEDAALLFIAIQDWHQLIQIVKHHAQTLVAQGRNKTLEEWLLSFPRDMLENTPWLLYWLGVCRLSSNPSESRHYFDAAFERFCSQADQTGMWLSWSYAVDTIFYEWEDISPLDTYARVFHDIYRKEVPFPSSGVESRVVSCRFIIMMLRQMDHPEISAWAERVFMLMQKSHNANFRLQIGYYLAIYYFWIGNFSKMQIVVNSLHKDILSEAASPLLSLFGRATESMYAFISGSIGSCLRIVSDGLKFAQKTGVHLWDNHLLAHGTLASLSAGDIMTASDLLGKMEPSLPTARKIDFGFYHFLSSWKSLLNGDILSAARYTEIAMNAVIEVGTPFPIAVCRFWEAQVLFELGKTTEAETRLDIARQIGRQIKSKNLEFICLLAEAQFALNMKTFEGEKCGDTDIGLRIADLPESNEPSANQNQKSEIAKRGLEALRKAMELGREEGYVNMFCWRYDVIPELCVKALEAGIEVEYVRNLVSKRNLIPDDPPIQCENWPWPIKIFTLGRFMILHDDKPIQCAGKVQQKPLEMLKAILSVGGGEAPEDRLIDALWPDAEGDAAHRAFEITLHRLRRLMGSDKAVKRQGGQVSLDKRYCWVDMMSFERLAENIEDMRREMGKRGVGEWENPPTHSTVSPLLQLTVSPFPRFHPSSALPITPPQTEMLRLVEKAMNVYKGAFLLTETRHAWTASARERLRGKFRHLVIALGAHLEQTQQWGNAAEYYRKAIEKDNLAEAFYQRLIICYQQLGQRAQGVEVYHRLKNALSEAFGIEPSPLIESLYKSLFAARISSNS